MHWDECNSVDYSTSQLLLKIQALSIGFIHFSYSLYLGKSHCEKSHYERSQVLNEKKNLKKYCKKNPTDKSIVFHSYVLENSENTRFLKILENPRKLKKNQQIFVKYESYCMNHTKKF